MKLLRDVHAHDAHFVTWLIEDGGSAASPAGRAPPHGQIELSPRAICAAESLPWVGLVRCEVCMYTMCTLWDMVARTQQHSLVCGSYSGMGWQVEVTLGDLCSGGSKNFFERASGGVRSVHAHVAHLVSHILMLHAIRNSVCESTVPPQFTYAWVLGRRQKFSLLWTAIAGPCGRDP